MTQVSAVNVVWNFRHTLWVLSLKLMLIMLTVFDAFVVDAVSCCWCCCSCSCCCCGWQWCSYWRSSSRSSCCCWYYRCKNYRCCSGSWYGLRDAFIFTLIFTIVWQTESSKNYILKWRSVWHSIASTKILLSFLPKKFS